MTQPNGEIILSLILAARGELKFIASARSSACASVRFFHHNNRNGGTHDADSQGRHTR
jgi:hypothetical protein